MKNSKTSGTSNKIFNPYKISKETLLETEFRRMLAHANIATLPKIEIKLYCLPDIIFYYKQCLHLFEVKMLNKTGRVKKNQKFYRQIGVMTYYKKYQGIRVDFLTSANFNYHKQYIFGNKPFDNTTYKEEYKKLFIPKQFTEDLGSL